jgi:glycosyltransferase involved in cell wall biosynthesis
MKIRWHGLLGTNHSWAFSQQALARAMIAAGGHEVFLKSTNGLKHFPSDLQDRLLAGFHTQPGADDGQSDFLVFRKASGELVRIPKPPIGKPVRLQDVSDGNRPYDLELAYTIFMQGPRRFYPETPCRMVIWNFESSVLPPGWHLYHRAVDYVLPSSKYSADIFIQNGMPSDKVVRVPHGVYTEMFNPGIPPMRLHTQKRVKFLHNAIPHHRKLHERVLEAYLEAFTADDDVCLVMKTKLKTPEKTKPFEVDVREILKKVLKGRKKAPEIEIINAFVPDIGSLYTACDAVVSMSAAEGFNLTLLEGLACGSLVIAPRHGGQLDFLNDENSLLVDTGEMRAPFSMQYWTRAPHAVVGDPDARHCAELMRRVYEDPAGEKARVAEPARRTVEEFTWERPARQILDLAETCLAGKRASGHPAKKKVLFIVPYQMAGGGEVWVREAIARLDRIRYEPSVACPLGTSFELMDMLLGLDVDIEDLMSQGMWEASGDPKGAPGRGLMSLKCLIESGKYDIVHFYNSLQIYSTILRCMQGGGWSGKVVETVHSELMWPDSMMKVGARKGVSAIIAVSSGIARKLLKLGNKNVMVLPQQVDWKRFRVERRSKAVLKEFGVPDGFTVGMVTRISPEKNVAMAVACAKAMPDAGFVIVGDGKQRDIMELMASKLKRRNIHFLGRRGDPERFYPAFDVLLLPSIVEGVPLVALEAMTAGTPVVASDVGAVSEIVQDGHNGFLVWNPGQLRLFVEAIARLQDKKLWRSFSKAAKEKAASMERLGETTSINNIYDDLLAG